MFLNKKGAVALCATLALLAGTALAEPAQPAARALTAVTQERLAKGTADDSGWVMYGGSYDNARYSPLADINRGNVKQLAPAWIFQSGIAGQLEAAPIVADGVLYLTAAFNNLYALDAKSGDIIWHYEHQMPSDLRICCGPTIAAWRLLVTHSIWRPWMRAWWRSTVPMAKCCGTSYLTITRTATARPPHRWW